MRDNKTRRVLITMSLYLRSDRLEHWLSLYIRRGEISIWIYKEKFIWKNCRVEELMAAHAIWERDGLDYRRVLEGFGHLVEEFNYNNHALLIMS